MGHAGIIGKTSIHPEMNAKHKNIASLFRCMCDLKTRPNQLKLTFVSLCETSTFQYYIKTSPKFEKKCCIGTSVRYLRIRIPNSKFFGAA